jgi:hypothetical protein
MAVGMNKLRRDFGRIKWGYFQRAEKLGLSVLVDIKGGNDLVPVTFWDAQDQTIEQIAKKANDMVLNTKQKKNQEHNEVTKIFTILPTWLLGFLTTVCSYLAQNVGISIKALNVR